MFKNYLKFAKFLINSYKESIFKLKIKFNLQNNFNLRDNQSQIMKNFNEKEDFLKLKSKSNSVDNIRLELGLYS